MDSNLGKKPYPPYNNGLNYRTNQQHLQPQNFRNKIQPNQNILNQPPSYQQPPLYKQPSLYQQPPILRQPPLYQQPPTLQKTKSNPYKINPQLRQTISNNSKNIFQSNNSVSLKKYAENLGNLVNFQNKCGICEIETNNVESICVCEHKYCTNCLTQYIKYKVNINEDIHCPDQSCDKAINEECQFFINLPKQIMDKYQRNKRWKQNINNQNVRLCPQQNCRQGLIDLRLNPPKCGSCQKTFCVSCEMESHQGPCDKNFQKIFTQWKRCPNCHMFIQKTQGCNHMTCKCSYQFCFICLDPWQQKHYHCGNQTQVDLHDERPPTFIHQNWCINKIILLVAILMFPFLILIGVILSVIVLIGAGILAAIFGPCYVCVQSLKGGGSGNCGNCGGCNGQGALFCLMIFLAIYAIVGIVCALYGIIFILTAYVIPQFGRSCQKYCRWMSHLWSHN